MTTLPLRIENGQGETLIFERQVTTPTGERLEVRNEVQPGAGPPMHVHFKQEEGLTVIAGRMGYQVQGESPRYAEPGETVVFAAGIAHRFWAEGEQVLRCTGYVQPPHNLVYFLSEIYRSTRQHGKKPDDFEAAFLLHKYRSEFALLDIPAFVQRTIFPVLRLIGRVTGKYGHLAQGPEPVR
ncbi:MAG TPA: cupin domain-containing protein [Thermomicrobiales bacterium]|jgi:quercetin dioxygenase-like cupin family protein